MDGNFGGVNPVSRLLLIEEVEEIISQAALAGGILRIGRHVKRLGVVHQARALLRRASPMN